MTSTAFSFNLPLDVANMLHYGFMLHAFEAGSVVAVVAGVIGYFIVLRRSSFAAHALSHIGFAGAAGAVLLSVNPLLGLFAFTSAGGISIAALGRNSGSRDVEIGTVLAFMLGLGILFISLYSGYATEAYSILFGEILGISSTDVAITAATGFLLLVAVVAIYRPLLFSSIDEAVAEARGVPVFRLNAAFMLLVAAATSIAVQVVGVLLIFALMVTPAAIAERVTRRPLHGLGVSVLVAVLATWFGLFISFYLPYPVSFFITSATFSAYLLVRFLTRRSVST